jgi:hypothetical protein
MVDGVNLSSKEEIESYVVLKLRTRNIISRLRNAATKCYAPLGLRMLMLADRIEVGLQNRNMAAHGAWTLHNSGHLEVEHYLRNKDKELRYISERIKGRDVDTALDDADSILREAVELHEAFRSLNRQFFSFKAQSQVGTRIEPSINQGQGRPVERRSDGLANVRKQLLISTTLSGGLANLSR